MANSMAGVTKRFRTPVPASKRADIARAAHLETKSRELLYASIIARLWPSFLTVPTREDALFPYLVCIDTPAGRLAYKLTESDRTGFQHVTETREKDDAPSSSADKFARLLHLATEGWI